MNTILTDRETLVLRMLTKKMGVQQIREKLQITPESVHSYCYLIRKKTGITDTSDHQQCLLYLRTGTAIPSTRTDLPVTHKQVSVFRLLSAGYNYKQIAKSLGGSPQTIKNCISQGCKRARIHRGNMRLHYIRLFLKGLDDTNEWQPDLMEDPMF